jgi:hypothetical protein
MLRFVHVNIIIPTAPAPLPNQLLINSDPTSSPKLLIQLPLNRSMIPINPIRPTTNRQQIIRNPHALWQLTRQIPRKKRNPLSHIRLKRIRNRSKPLHTARALLIRSSNIVLLLENEFARALDGYESPGGVVRVRRQGDFFRPGVAEFQGEDEVFVDAAAAAVGAAPVCWVGDEVEDDFGWVGEGCFGGDAEFSHGCVFGFGFGLDFLSFTLEFGWSVAVGWMSCGCGMHRWMRWLIYPVTLTFWCRSGAGAECTHVSPGHSIASCCCAM